MADILDDSLADTAGALDLVLAGAALPLRRFRPGAETIRLAARLARQPRPVASRTAGLMREYGRIARGRSDVAPEGGDRRFADPAWNTNPVLHRLAQTYLATGRAAEGLLDDAQLNWRDDQRARFLVENVVDAAAPSNNPLLNPVAWKAAIDTGGASIVRGASNLIRDMASPPRVPTMVEPSAFRVGSTLGLTPGGVVAQTPMFELIQYTPQTERVRAVPLLIVPPVINKYYILDIAPGRSLVEYLLGEGQQVFVISWRNPDARHRDWGLDAYGQAILDALEVVLRIGGINRSHVLALCSGGIIASMVASTLAATAGLERLATLSLGVTVLDQARAGLASALIDERTAALAVAASARRGYLDGRALAEVFAWLRPNDLVWNYWVNNYLEGKKPPAFDVLYWNADTTRMTAHLHRDFIGLAMTNALTRSGEATMLDQPVDLSRVDIDGYVIAGIADHLCPWQSCYATTQLLGGNLRFVLSTSGHIASLVNPPTNQKATFQTNEDNVPDPGTWLRRAITEKGSWWPDFARWLGERSEGERDAPATVGSPDFPPRQAAPGTYVYDR